MRNNKIFIICFGVSENKDIFKNDQWVNESIMEVFVEQPLALNGYASNVCCLPILCPHMRYWMDGWILATCVICIGKGKVQTVLTHLSFKIQTIGTDNWKHYRETKIPIRYQPNLISSKKPFLWAKICPPH